MGDEISFGKYKFKHYHAIVIIIAVIMSSAISGFVYNYGIVNDDFEIYKEECSSIDKNCDKKCVEFCIESISQKMEDSNNTYFTNITKRFYDCLIETNDCCEDPCELIKINHKKLSEAWDICWYDGIPKDDFIVCSLMEEGKPLDFGSYENTVNWLEGNCKYEEVCSKKHNVCSEIDKNIILGQLNQGWHISKYKCGDYIVDLK